MGSLGGLPAPSLRWEAGSTVVPWASLTTRTPLAPTRSAPHRPRERPGEVLPDVNSCKLLSRVSPAGVADTPDQGGPHGRPRALRPARREATGAGAPGAAVTADTPAPTLPPSPRPARDAGARAPVHPSRSRPPCARPRGVGEGFLKGPTRVVTHQPVGGPGVTAPGDSARSAESSVTRSRSSDGEQRRRRVHAAWAAPQGRDPLVRAGAAAAGGGDAAERPSRLDGC